MQTMSAEPAVYVKAYRQQLIRAHRSPQALDPPIAVPNGLFRKLDVEPHRVAFTG